MFSRDAEGERLKLSTVATALILAAALLAHGAERASVVADAAEARDHFAITSLLQQGTDVNGAQPDGMTALHWAAWHDDVKLARKLIDAGANARAENRYHVTPLSLACTNGSAAMIELLLGAGADPNTALPGGETALMTAARTGVPRAVKVLLKRGADVNAKARRDQTAIMWAAADGHAEVVKLLIDAGADYRTPLPSGFTPFFFAIREGRTEVVRVLLDSGGSGGSGGSGDSGGGIDVNEPMDVDNGGPGRPRKNTSPLILAVENGHFDLALTLLEAGADPNDQRSGFTALHTLTWVRKPDRGDNGDPSPIGSGKLDSLQFVEQLVRHGADVNAKLERGTTGGATRQRNRVSTKGATPFFMAADTDDVPLMKLLVKLGADPLIPNAEGTTPLMVAAGVGTQAPTEEAGTEDEAIEAVKLCIQWGADVNTVDEHGETAMHGAAYKSLPRMVKLLAEHGASIEVWNRPNAMKWTPLIIAQGIRPGNFKPAPDTIAAISELMLAAGITPPPPPERDNSQYKY